jgi:hypothetical protein
MAQMLRKIAFGIAIVIFAGSILLVSILRTAAVRYEFSRAITPTRVTDEIFIDYYLAYPGKVLPDSVLWPLKALRDRLWLWITTDGNRKADLLLLFADKRLAGSLELFDKGKFEIAYASLEKSQMYLSEASLQAKKNKEKQLDTREFNSRLAKASLKHYQVMGSLISKVPDDAKPEIIKLQNVPRKVFEDVRNRLLEMGEQPPENPFNWQ